MCGFVAVSVALMAAAAVASGVQGIQAGNAQQSAANKQAKYVEAAQVVQDADRKRQLVALEEQQRNLYGAAGLDSVLGTPTDTAAYSAQQSGRDQYAADLQSANQASSLETSGANAVTSAWNSAFSNVLSTAGKASNMFGAGSVGAAGASAGTATTAAGSGTPN